MQLNNIQEALTWAKTKISTLDAELLLCDVTGLSRPELYIHCNDSLDFELFVSYVERRINHEPIQYITGKAYFRDLELNVGPGVLIPRPETELIPDMIDDANSIIDICTGSGCLAISLAKKFPSAKVVATDISEDALKYAKSNILKYDLKNIKLIKANLAEGIKDSFDVIVSNPPYIPTDVYNNLDTEVKNFEPEIALNGGNDGLLFLNPILKFSQLHAKKCILELHEDCLQKAKRAAQKFSFNSIEVINDLNEKERFLSIIV